MNHDLFPQTLLYYYTHAICLLGFCSLCKKPWIWKRRRIPYGQKVEVPVDRSHFKEGQQLHCCLRHTVPKGSLRKTVEKDCERFGASWGELTGNTGNREWWGIGVVNSPYPRRDKYNNIYMYSTTTSAGKDTLEKRRKSQIYWLLRSNSLVSATRCLLIHVYSEVRVEINLKIVQNFVNKILKGIADTL